MYSPPDKAVIASLAFHPTDHVLLIATSNKLLFWSWDQSEPFACVQTASVEEKIRYVNMYNTGAGTFKLDKDLTVYLITSLNYGAFQCR